MNNNRIYITKERLIEIENELKRLTTEGRRKMAEKIAEARAHGDLSENAEYDAAKEEQAKLEAKISQLQNILANAEIIDRSKLPKDQATILSTVIVKNLKTNKTFEYTLVSPEESDMNSGKISYTSPVGQGLMGKKKGEKVQIKVPAGILELEIIDIKID